jgi:hypothetical protein
MTRRCVTLQLLMKLFYKHSKLIFQDFNKIWKIIEISNDVYYKHA